MNREFHQKVLECYDRARVHYSLPVDTHTIVVSYDLRGKVAGTAGYRDGLYRLRFNPEAIEKHYEDMVSDTIPHEVAHLVAFMRPNLGAKGHNWAWRSICMRLGGKGARCHSYSLTKAKRTRKFIYRVAGQEITLGLTRHRKMQKGAVYLTKSGLRLSQSQFLREAS